MKKKKTETDYVLVRVFLLLLEMAMCWLQQGAASYTSKGFWCGAPLTIEKVGRYDWKEQLKQFRRSIYEEWVDVVEETNTVFDGDDANVSSKGGVLHTNYVYPDKVNLFTEKG